MREKDERTETMIPRQERSTIAEKGIKNVCIRGETNGSFPRRGIPDV